MKDQLSLFSGAAASEAERILRPVVNPVRNARDAELASLLPPFLHFGTSSWTFPGWAGLVYEAPVTTKDLVASGLKAYAQNPLFSSVGIDRSYYAPLARAELDAYAADVPAGFRAVATAWNEVTIYVFPDHPSAGARAGQRNPNFMSADIVRHQILPAFEGAFAEHTRAIVFEMPPIPDGMLPRGRELCERIGAMLEHLPSTFSYAFEPRNREIVTPRYLSTLRAHRAAHVLSYWSGVPPLALQLKIPFPASFVVLRVMQPPRTRYEQLRAAYAPFDKLVRVDPDMRDDVVRLVRMCAESERDLYVLVGNKSEGCAPLTVRALAEMVVAARV
ncbi:MAG: DUF72 domain-containing protein [Polyangiaceae bacterium]